MEESVRATNELIERLRSRLVPQGREILEEIERIGGDRFRGSISDAEVDARQEEVRASMARLLERDRETIFRIFKLQAKAHEELARAHERELEHARAARWVRRRAVELDANLGPDSSFREAAEVLERNGEKVPDGLDLERVVGVPGE